MKIISIYNSNKIALDLKELTQTQLKELRVKLNSKLINDRMIIFLDQNKELFFCTTRFCVINNYELVDYSTFIFRNKLHERFK